MLSPLPRGPPVLFWELLKPPDSILVAVRVLNAIMIMLVLVLFILPAGYAAVPVPTIELLFADFVIVAETIGPVPPDMKLVEIVELLIPEELVVFP